MIWYKSFEFTEIIVSVLFIILYVLYIIRLWGVSTQLGVPFHRVFIKLCFRSLAFCLLIIAILGPLFGNSQKEIKSIGKDIILCVDLSKSMDAFDIKPTRLEKIKFEMKRIVAAFGSDRVGVIIFSSEAFVQCPLTYDQNALNLFIETMNTSLVPGGGTDFAPPLRMALSKLETNDGPPTQTKSKIIILVSDGEDFGDESRTFAEKIEDKGIRLFTLGIGTERGGNIYVGNQLKKDREGNVVTSKLASDELKKLASSTGGQYFEINENRNDVSKLINTISKIEGEFREARVVDVSANKYYYPLLAATLLLMLDTLLPNKIIKI